MAFTRSGIEPKELANVSAAQIAELLPKDSQQATYSK
jgi:hypothetical protein